MSKGNNQKLKPALGLVATAINVGAIIGAGVYIVTDIVAGLAGPAMIISIVLAVVVALFTALSFPELSNERRLGHRWQIDKAIHEKYFPISI